MKKKLLKTIFGAVEVPPYCDAELMQIAYDMGFNLKAYDVAQHTFVHYCESGNRFTGIATIFRNKKTKQYDCAIGWASTAARPVTIPDLMERDFGWTPETTLVLEKIIGRELDFRPLK